jgi:hypothetical protein
MRIARIAPATAAAPNRGFVDFMIAEMFPALCLPHRRAGTPSWQIAGE